MITRALHLLLIKKLIAFDIQSDVVTYKTSHIGTALFGELKTNDFAAKYVDVAKKLVIISQNFRLKN